MIRDVLRASDQGQELVEFALILPLLLLLLFGIMEFGVVVFTYNTLANVGREVARYGAVHPEDAEIESYINDEILGDPHRWTTGIHADSVLITPTLRNNGPLTSTVNVTVTYTYELLTGPVISALGGKPDIRLRTVTTMYTERSPAN